MRGRVHGVDGDDSTHTVGHLGDGGHVVHGADRIGSQADGNEPGLPVYVPLEVILVERKGFWVYANPAHLRALLSGGYEPGVHVSAVV